MGGARDILGAGMGEQELGLGYTQALMPLEQQYMGKPGLFSQIGQGLGTALSLAAMA
jgi:hypothetical protein